jgi:hypothetical protein
MIETWGTKPKRARPLKIEIARIPQEAGIRHQIANNDRTMAQVRKQGIQWH